jgi:hypothetical protein
MVPAGSGFTVMVNVPGVPAQPFAEGVTVIVAVTGLAVVLVAVKAGIAPVPVAPRPMDVALLVQLYVVPLTALVKATGVVLWPEHSVWFAIVFTPGVGFTVMVNVCAVPGQPLAVGVTVTVAATGEVVVFVAVNEAIFPVPDAARPIEGVLLVHV